MTLLAQNATEHWIYLYQTHGAIIHHNHRPIFHKVEETEQRRKKYLSRYEKKKKKKNWKNRLQKQVTYQTRIDTD